MSESTEYNGHPSYDHWNVALWVGGDEQLYRTAMDYDDSESFAEWLLDFMPITNDGVTITPALAAYAWDSVHEDDA